MYILQKTLEFFTVIIYVSKVTVIILQQSGSLMMIHRCLILTGELDIQEQESVILGLTDSIIHGFQARKQSSPDDVRICVNIK